MKGTYECNLSKKKSQNSPECDKEDTKSSKDN